MHIYQGPLLQLTIDLWNTTTPNTGSHIAECTYTKATPSFN